MGLPLDIVIVVVAREAHKYKVKYYGICFLIHGYLKIIDVELLLLLEQQIIISLTKRLRPFTESALSWHSIRPDSKHVSSLIYQTFFEKREAQFSI